MLRAGFGIFYDRLSETDSLKAARFNGTTQQSYIVQNPDFIRPSHRSPACRAAARLNNFN